MMVWKGKARKNAGKNYLNQYNGFQNLINWHLFEQLSHYIHSFSRWLHIPITHKPPLPLFLAAMLNQSGICYFKRLTFCLGYDYTLSYCITCLWCCFPLGKLRMLPFSEFLISRKPPKPFYSLLDNLHEMIM